MTTTNTKLNDQSIVAVRKRADIVEVVSQHVELTPTDNGNLQGLCPFHDEKTPSFTVAPQRNVYFCHGCGQGGDVINFVQKIDNVNFTEAVERLILGFGIVLNGPKAPMKISDEQLDLAMQQADLDVMQIITATIQGEQERAAALIAAVAKHPGPAALTIQRMTQDVKELCEQLSRAADTNALRIWLRVWRTHGDLDLPLDRW